MTIYEIDQSLLSLVDPETGEIMDFDAFADLQMEREAKIENMALWVKNLEAQANAIHAEEKALSQRRKSVENKAEGLKRYLASLLNGERYSTARVAISFRKGSRVDVDDAFVEWALSHADNLLRYSDPEADKNAIKEHLKNGGTLELARLVETQTIQIK